MADVTGQRGTLSGNQSLRAIDMREEILLLEPDSTPLTVFTAKLPKARTKDPLFKWAEDALDPRFTTTSTSYNTTATSIVVATGTGTYFAKDDLVRVTATGETMRVLSVSTDTLTVSRGVGAASPGTGQAISSGGELLILGSIQPEGDTAKVPRSTNAVVKTNYTAIIRDPFASTRTNMQSDQLTTPNDWAYQARKKGIEHAKSIEYQFLLSHPSEDTSGPYPRRATGGAYHFVSTNVTAVGGTLTESTFWNALRGAFRFGSKDKVAFGASKVVQVLNQFPLGRLQVRSGESTYGLRVFTYYSPFGTLHLVNHWLLEGTELGGHLLVLDMEQVRYRYLQNENGSSDTHVRQNIQQPDTDGRMDEYLTEAGLEFGLEKTHALLTGITG